MPQGFSEGDPCSPAKMHLRVSQTSHRLPGRVRMQILEYRIGSTSLMGEEDQQKQTSKNPTSFRKPQNFFLFFLYNFVHALHME